MELPFTVNGIKAYYADDDAFDTRTIAENQAYVLDADGWNLYVRNNITESLNGVKIDAGMPRLKAMCNLRSAKIPYDLIRKVGKFFAEVYKLHKSEAVGYLYYAPSKGWLFWPPDQTATTAHCKYGEPAVMEGYRVAGTIHSHGSMSAFHSGTDEKDEANFDGVHITIGKVDEVRHDLALSVVCSGVRYKCSEDQLISGFGDTAVPNEWIDAVKRPEPAVQPLPASFQRYEVKDTRASGGVGGHYDQQLRQWIPDAPSASASPNGGGNSSGSSNIDGTGAYRHFYTEEEWAKLSKRQRKAIIKEQKGEGGEMLSFFDSHRFGY